METNRLTPRNHRIRQEVVLGERVDLTHKMEADRSNPYHHTKSKTGELYSGGVSTGSKVAVPAHVRMTQSEEVPGVEKQEEWVDLGNEAVLSNMEGAQGHQQVC